MKIHDAIWGAFCMLLGGAVLFHVQGFPAMPGQRFGPAVFPGIIAAGFLVCGVLLLIRGLRHSQSLLEIGPWGRSRKTQLRMLALLVAIGFYILASESLGFLLTASLTLSALLIVFAVPAKRAVLIAVLSTLAIHLLFYKVMRVPLPWGVLTPFAW